MELNCTIASSLLFQSFMWGNNIMSFALNYAYHSKDRALGNNIDCTTRPSQVEHLITHGIADKAANLSEATR